MHISEDEIFTGTGLVSRGFWLKRSYSRAYRVVTYKYEVYAG